MGTAPTGAAYSRPDRSHRHQSIGWFRGWGYSRPEEEIKSNPKQAGDIRGVVEPFFRHDGGVTIFLVA
jgi:hypothetical protein